LFNVKEYIDSGILELYVAGLLTEEENKKVDELASQYPEINFEIEKIISSVSEFASAGVPDPSPSVLNNILKNADTDTSKNNENIVLNVSTNSVNSGKGFYKYGFAFCLVLFIVSGLINLFLWNDLNSVKDEVEKLNAEKTFMAQDNELLKKTLNKKNLDLDVMMNPSTVMVDLKGVEKSPNSNVKVFYNKNDKLVYLEVKDLPAPPKGKQYQLWALDNGKPIDAGMLNYPENITGLQKMKPIENAQAFAITLEPEGGSVNPTLEQMVVIGNL